ncbi:MAG: AMIN-like domain-containing (lipo)protein [Pseudonocardiaceae bacterium]
MTTTVRRTFFALATIVLALVGGLVAAAPASATSTPVMTGIRTGLNAGYDRVVLDMSGPQPGVSYRLVDELIADGSGEIVWLTGEQFIEVTVNPAAAHTEAGTSTYTGPQKFRTRNLRNVMAVAVTGDYEAVLSIGIGTRYRSWVRVFTLGSPTRVVIDVGH